MLFVLKHLVGLEYEVRGAEHLPEGAALVAALEIMKGSGAVAADARVVLVLTGAGFKYDPPALPAPVDLTGADDDIVTAVRTAVGA